MCGDGGGGGGGDFSGGGFTSEGGNTANGLNAGASVASGESEEGQNAGSAPPGATGGWGLPTSEQPGVQATMGKGGLTPTDEAMLTALSFTPIPLASTMLGVAVRGARAAGQPEGDVGTISTGGIGPSSGGETPTIEGSGYYGPATAPVQGANTTTTSSPYIIPPTITQTGLQYSAERGKTPEEIDAANKLRLAREQAYAKQRANAETELLKSLSLRDVTSGNPESRLTESQPSAVRFTGLPPTLGQSRHRWA
jgi:hypothetical protein